MTEPTFFATAPRGMADLLAIELRDLGADEVRESSGGVSFRGSLETAYRACLWSRLANRILLPVAAFDAPDPETLYRNARSVDWSAHLDPDSTIAVDANLSASKIDHSHFAALRIKDAIVDQMSEHFGKRPSVDTEKPGVRINAHIRRDHATLYIDLSGKSLHLRGYRLEAGSAPLKENLAAAILMRARWPEIATQGGALVDPMCGSGTIAIEAALMAADIAPSLGRSYFGFSGWKGHDPAVWSALSAEAEQRKANGLKNVPSIMGFDVDRRVLDRARANAERAGVDSVVSFAYQDISSFRHDFPAHGLLVTNPPYGKRLMESGDLASLYQSLGRVMISTFSGWKAAVFTQDAELGREIGLRSPRQHTLYNGALACKLIHFDIKEENVLRYDRLPAALPDEELSDAARGFGNRLQKNLKQLKRWVKRESVYCYRVYDADLPDYAVAIDFYSSADAVESPFVCIQEYEAPSSVDPRKAKRRLREVRSIVQKEFGLDEDHLFLKTRSRQRGASQYEKTGDSKTYHEVTEGSCRLLVNFEDYLDTGLFLDHRPVRTRIFAEARGKHFLNLFCYTGAATVHAALGGAASSTSVDLSNTYLDWARRNLLANKVDLSKHDLVQADCLDWLQSTKGAYDLIFLDPPTFSNSKRMQDTLDIQRDHVALIQASMRLLAPGGTLYFSTNLRSFRLDSTIESAFSVEDISKATIPNDFKRRQNIHRCFRIRLASD